MRGALFFGAFFFRLTGSLVRLVQRTLGDRRIKIRQGKGPYQRAKTLVLQGHFHTQWQRNIRAAARGQSGHDFIGGPLRLPASVGIQKPHFQAFYALQKQHIAAVIFLPLVHHRPVPAP